MLAPSPRNLVKCASVNTVRTPENTFDKNLRLSPKRAKFIRLDINKTKKDQRRRTMATLQERVSSPDTDIDRNKSVIAMSSQHSIDSGRKSPRKATAFVDNTTPSKMSKPNGDGKDIFGGIYLCVYSF